MEATVLNQLFRPEYVREAIEAIETIRAFTDYVLSCLAPGPSVELRRMMRVNPLGYRKATQRFGILFGPTKDIVLVAAVGDNTKPTEVDERADTR
jgi:hypothetical protein